MRKATAEIQNRRAMKEDHELSKKLCEIIAQGIIDDGIEYKSALLQIVESVVFSCALGNNPQETLALIVELLSEVEEKQCVDTMSKEFLQKIDKIYKPL